MEVLKCNNCRNCSNCWAKIAQNDRSHGMDISRIIKVKKIEKKIRKMTPLTVKNEFSKKFKSLQCNMIQGTLNPNITFLCEKL